MLEFVNFKLYHGLGLRYPPVLDSQKEKAATGLVAIMHDIAANAGGVGLLTEGAPVADPESAIVKVSCHTTGTPCIPAVLCSTSGGQDVLLV